MFNLALRNSRFWISNFSFPTLQTTPNPPYPSLFAAEKSSIAILMMPKSNCEDSSSLISSTASQNQHIRAVASEISMLYKGTYPNVYNIKKTKITMSMSLICIIAYAFCYNALAMQTLSMCQLDLATSQAQIKARTGSFGSMVQGIGTGSQSPPISVKSSFNKI